MIVQNDPCQKLQGAQEAFSLSKDLKVQKSQLNNMGVEKAKRTTIIKVPWYGNWMAEA